MTVGFVELQAALVAAGFQEGTPPRFGLHDSPEANAGVAAGAACEACGRVGLRYRPFFRAEPRSYVAVAVCPRCQWATEF